MTERVNPASCRVALSQIGQPVCDNVPEPSHYGVAPTPVVHPRHTDQSRGLRNSGNWSPAGAQDLVTMVGLAVKCYTRSHLKESLELWRSILYTGKGS